jgi:hypothetical protein
MTTTNSATIFPFKLEHLKGWTVKRSDGTITNYQMVSPGQDGLAAQLKAQQTLTALHQSTTTATRKTYGLSEYCNHRPGDTPIAAVGDRRFWIGSMWGAKATRDTFDFVVDCGDVLDLPQGGILTGDKALTATLSEFTNQKRYARVLKIDWDDRAAAPVPPQFWTKLLAELHGDIMTCCVGGHGRSGTSFTCLLLNLAPDYDALDAIIHLRAVHCPRAIESVAQHDYIDAVAKHLGRTPNAKSCATITDYKGAFLVSTKPTAIATRKMLGWTK